MPSPTDVPVAATETAFAIVETLRDHDGARLSTVAEELSLPTSTAHDHLKTLESLGYVVREDEEYHVAVRFLGLGEHARRRSRLFRVAQPEIDRLSEETGEHANLFIEEHGQGIFLYKATGDHAVRLDTHPGMQVPLQTTAAGKAILAFAEEERVDAIVDRHGLPSVTEQTITDRSALDSALADVRDRGYALDDEERVEGMRCVAAPILTDGDVVGAVSVSGPVSRFEGDTWDEEMPNRVQSTANVIEVNLAYS